jgi:hypothetical protein
MGHGGLKEVRIARLVVFREAGETDARLILGAEV